ncbi:MAG: arylsulfatase [Carboxylicivirga sp.]|jgi:arylsulfatase A-like enzyme|nr:arylsulfatase [Carboxylicivirga sp.]
MKISLIKNIRQGAVLLCFALAFVACISAKEESKKPNIIYILADDLGYGDVSCLNKDSKIQTPSLDALAGQSVVFTDAHTNAAVCTPTRYGILTGRYNWRSTLKRGALTGFQKGIILPERSTVADLLKKQDYQTACIGKWHLGWEWNNVEAGDDKVDYSKPIGNGPNSCGFDYFYGFCGSLDMPPYVWVENDRPTMVPTKEITGHRKVKYGWWRDGICSDDFKHEEVLTEMTQRATKYIAEKANDEKPFFLYFPLSAPHTPILPTDEFKGKSGLDSPYADFVLMVDWVVGQVTQTLKEKGIEDNTMIVFTSDNGCSPEANYKHLAEKGHDPSYVFRGHKADVFEGGHRVPFFVSWPAKVKSGTSADMTCTTDFYATLADLFQIKLDDTEGEDSYSMMHSLGLESTYPKRESMVMHSGNGEFAYRKGDWKACFCPGSGGWSFPHPSQDKELIATLPKVQLYNLKSDIAEESNLQDKHSEMVEEFRAELKTIILEGRSTAGTSQKNDGPEYWEQLKFLKDVQKK